LAAFGQAVRALRLERGFSQERLAEESGLHPRYISDVERGRRNISLVNIERLGIALGVDLPTLLAEADRTRGV
jgi:transcriptional regulator with XRE-family HTH domain